VVSLASPELTSGRPLGSLKSPKSRLQEFTQRLSGERPQYRLVGATGPDHDKTFRVEVAVSGRVIGVGEGSSRRLAETAAAARAIEALRSDPGELSPGSEGAPELEYFGVDEPGDPEAESGSWSGNGNAMAAAHGPWDEIDMSLLPGAASETEGGRDPDRGGR